MLVDEQARQRLAQEIGQQEKSTDAELIVVLCTRADGYHFISFSAAAVFGVLIGAFCSVLVPWLSAMQVVTIQLLVWLVFAVVLRHPFLLRRLVPKSLQHRRAFNLARQLFVENGLHHTRAETGVMIFLCELEHYVEILADRGVSQRVENSEWQRIIDALVLHLKKREIEKGLSECISGSGQVLTELVPNTYAKNELPNHLIIIE